MDDQLSDSEEIVTAIDDVTPEEEPQEVVRPGSRRKMSMKSADEESEPTEATPPTPMLVRHSRSNSETPPMQTKRSGQTETSRSRRSRSFGELVLVLGGQPYPLLLQNGLQWLGAVLEPPSTLPSAGAQAVAITNDQLLLLPVGCPYQVEQLQAIDVVA